MLFEYNKEIGTLSAKCLFKQKKESKFIVFPKLIMNDIKNCDNIKEKDQKKSSQVNPD